jgi:ketosteroid isomerase-like protein
LSYFAQTFAPAEHNFTLYVVFVTFRTRITHVTANGPEPENHADELAPNSGADDFFVKMKHDFRRPKPSEEAVAAALQAIQKVMKGATFEPSASTAAVQSTGEACPKCGAVNMEANRFCGYCGALLSPIDKTTAASQQPTSVAQHIYHHHYHHFSPPEENSRGPRVWTGEKVNSQPLNENVSSQPLEASDEIDATEAIHNLVRDWSLYFNSKRLDDLTGLYSTDAIVLRPNLAPAQGSTAIRQLLSASLEAGLGDVDLECADIGIVGDFACLTGRSKMLAPLAANKRQEETGKYLIVARRHAGEWQIVADSWCMDSKPSLASMPSAPVLPMRSARK